MQNTNLETIQIEALDNVTGGGFGGWMGMIGNALGGKNGGEGTGKGLGEMLGGGGEGLGLNKDGKPMGLSEKLGSGLSNFISGGGPRTIEGKGR